MQLFNLMAETITIYGETFNVSINWIGKIIRWLVNGAGVGFGIILFTLILKLIVLPFDIKQRTSMRKQNIKMKENKDKMEKLQKQYANDKEMYNQKLMEMYKENGISMFSSCLPMILSLVIFIVAINAFNSYSQYAAIENYNLMVNAYTTQLTDYTAEIKNENITVGSDENGNEYYLVDEDKEGVYISIRVKYDEAYKEDPAAYISTLDNMSEIKEFLVKEDATYAAFKDEVDSLLEKNKENTEYTKGVACKKVLQERAQEAVEKEYDEEVSGKMSFLWIKNIWQTDAAYASPVLSFSKFKEAAKQEDFVNSKDKEISFSTVNKNTDAYKKATYNEVTANLSAHKNEANGYFVLIVLSIGTILLQQWISMRSQKEQNQFSSVDGQGASQQKMTMIIMTVMFAIFSFMYSAAFSIYMIVGNLWSLAETVSINKIVDVVEAKKEEKAMQAKYNKRFPGRAAEDKNGKKKEKKNEKRK
ncbi:MAG: YidC/Oxa1 family membrane protein insertase [Clostridia bacterium]|nr:YidC/Oxa1 family membrane protein insertase [Clostridia bacterium]